MGAAAANPIRRGVPLWVASLAKRPSSVSTVARVSWPGRCTATYGEVKCWRECGHTLEHHGVGDTWWSTGEVPPPRLPPVDPSGVFERLAHTVPLGMVVEAAIVRPGDRRACGPAWLERLAIWLLERAGYVVCR